ncbi:MAG: DEAD/DEAH box helicase [Oligoflexia bacterium]|nr:DEAD/DEAH box helicase [Oligoflexia bacterium]
MSFDRLGLDPIICRAVSEAGYKSPTAIQLSAIPEVLAGRDLLASADTGTGKTAAFMLPALNRLTRPSRGTGKGPRVLVLTPTRELATQITNAARKYSRHMQRIRTVSILGGMPYEPQRRDLSQHVDIMVATPGRLLDHHREGRVDFRRVELLVLDEADRMLDMGFFEDVTTISNAASSERQTLLFSATLGKRILSLADSVTRDAKRIEIARSAQTNDNVSQSVICVNDQKHKFKVLLHLLERGAEGQVIVFNATKRGADRLSDELCDSGVSAIALHGDMRQNKRLQAIRKIRENKFRVLVATDVAARGIDICSVGLVVNFDLPRTAEDYTHRIGRTGRAGAQGEAVTFIARQDLRDFKAIERTLGHAIAANSIEGLEAGFDPNARAERRPDRSGRNGGGGRRPFRAGGGRFKRARRGFKRASAH